MKKLKYLILVFILFLTPNVFAAEFNMANNTSATQGGSTGYYNSLEIYNSGSVNRYKLNTRYNGQISTIETFFNYPFVQNITYRFTYNMATEDFRNNFGTSYWWDCSQSMTTSNAHTLSVSYISYKKIQYSIKPSANTTCIKVELRSRLTSSVAITGISNWNLSSITLYDPDWQSGSGSGQGTSTPTPSPSNNQDIINNQNNNTQDIINNQNDNTNTIVENNNNNTQDIINNQNELFGNLCPNLLNPETSVNGAFSDNDLTGNLNNTIDTITSDWITVKPNTSYCLSGSANRFRWQLKNSNEQITSSIWRQPCVVTSDDTSYLRVYYYLKPTGGFVSPSSITDVMLNEGTIFLPYCKFGSYSSKLDDTTNAINQQNQYLMDNSNPNISDNDFLNTFNSVGINDPLSYLLTLPTQLINKIVSLSDTCSTINLGTLYGVMISFPCINLENILGSSVWNIIDVIFSVSLLVVILKNLYDTFSNLLTMGAEKEAKEKFSMPTPMDFLSMILGGDR